MKFWNDIYENSKLFCLACSLERRGTPVGCWEVFGNCVIGWLQIKGFKLWCNCVTEVLRSEQSKSRNSIAQRKASTATLDDDQLWVMAHPSVMIMSIIILLLAIIIYKCFRKTRGWWPPKQQRLVYCLFWFINEWPKKIFNQTAHSPHLVNRTN